MCVCVYIYIYISLKASLVRAGNPLKSPKACLFVPSSCYLVLLTRFGASEYMVSGKNRARFKTRLWWRLQDFAREG